MQSGTIIGLKTSKFIAGVQGIKDGHPYERTLFGYYNGAGAFMAYPVSQLFIIWKNNKNGKIQSQDIYSIFKQKTNNARLSPRVKTTFINNNKDKVVPLVWKDDMLQIADFSVIDWSV